MAVTRVNLRGIRPLTRKVKEAVEEAVYDITDDLIRTSSEATPHWHGILEQSYGRDVGWNGKRIIAVVDYSITEEHGNNGFNYAYFIHEGDYNLGEKSLQKAAGGGGVGMSGNTYPVGKKFLTRVLEGEEATYKKYIQKVVDKAVE